MRVSSLHKKQPGEPRYPVARFARFTGWLLTVGVIALLVSKQWTGAVAVAVIAAMNFGIAKLAFRSGK